MQPIYEHGEDLPRSRLAGYSRVIREEDDDTQYRMLVRDLPRQFHRLPRDLQVAALKDPAPLTSACWDALLAAVTEHVALLHDHSIPD